MKAVSYELDAATKALLNEVSGFSWDGPEFKREWTPFNGRLIDNILADQTIVRFALDGSLGGACSRIQVIRDGKIEFDKELQNNDEYGAHLSCTLISSISPVTTYPKILVSHNSGSAHCCYKYEFYSIFPPKLIAKLSTGNASLEVGDEALSTTDDTFAYWNTSFGESPAPAVELLFQGTKLTVSPESISRHSGWDGQLFELVKYELSKSPYAIREQFHVHRENEWGVPPVLWQEMLNFLYAGQPKNAYIFFNEAWPADVGGKDVFFRSFLKQLWTSPYYPEIWVLSGYPKEFARPESAGN
ncbi:hypothetical protein [Novimethylophilus kurashikiensis]|nr:hypothetical protein [Novimethylophilus kurashikiensis]